VDRGRVRQGRRKSQHKWPWSRSLLWATGAGIPIGPWAVHRTFYRVICQDRGGSICPSGPVPPGRALRQEGTSGMHTQGLTLPAEKEAKAYRKLSTSHGWTPNWHQKDASWTSEVSTTKSRLWAGSSSTREYSGSRGMTITPFLKELGSPSSYHQDLITGPRL
jgi:hypothetical protein